MTTGSEKPADRLIVALDVPTDKEALDLVERLRNVVSFFKVGYQLFTASGPDFVAKLIQVHGKRVFLDLKMDDVPETIRGAVAKMAEYGVEFVTIHGNGATAAAANAGRGAGGRPKLLSLTLLSSLDEQDLRDILFIDKDQSMPSLMESYIRTRAHRALQTGCDGIIASGESIKFLRQELPQAIIVSPAIRPTGSGKDDHKRSATPQQAISWGADYLVVGRPIRTAADPEKMAASIINAISQAAAARSDASERI